MKILKYALIVLFSAGMMSCGGGGGDDEPDVDTTKPTVTIANPTANTVINAGDNLPVNFTASDNIALSSYTVIIAYTGAKSTKQVEEFSFDSRTGTDADGNALPTISGASKSISFNVATLSDNKVALDGMYKITISITDSSDNVSTKEVTFEIQ